MASEPEIPQASIVPTMFIGMGGTGSRIVDRIAMRAARLPHWESHLRALTQFVCVDTSHSDLKMLSYIPENNRIQIGAFDEAARLVGLGLGQRSLHDLRLIQILIDLSRRRR